MTRLEELSEAFFQPPSEGGGYLSLNELHELANLQHVELVRIKPVVEEACGYIDWCGDLNCGTASPLWKLANAVEESRKP